MTESLVVIRTFGSHLDADEAQVELLTAGIYSLLYSAENDSFTAQRQTEEIALAVHRRDVRIAEAVLTPRPRPT